MKILHLTDIHSDLQYLDSIVAPGSFDMVLLSGDITHFGKQLELKQIIKTIENKFPVPLYAVSGNCDYPEVSKQLAALVISIENKVINIDNIQLCGLGGSLHCPGTTPNEFTEDDYYRYLQNIENGLDSNKKIIFITHQPPHKTKNDRVLMGFHVGSKAVRKFIEKNQPIVCLTGHIHEGKGIDYIGECPIVNPGPFRNGRYAVIEFIGEQPPLINLF